MFSSSPHGREKNIFNEYPEVSRKCFHRVPRREQKMFSSSPHGREKYIFNEYPEVSRKCFHRVPRGEQNYFHRVIRDYVHLKVKVS